MLQTSPSAHAEPYANTPSPFFAGSRARRFSRRPWTPPRPELHDGDRVAFIGNTFVEREQVDDYIETALTSRYPDRNITFRNLGYSADTVTGEARGLCMGWAIFETSDKAFERLKKLVAEYKPTVLMINYGMTESFFGPEKLPEFTANYNKMLDALSAAAGTTPRIVLMSPNYHEDLGRPLPDPAGHNKNLSCLFRRDLQHCSRAEMWVYQPVLHYQGHREVECESHHQWHPSHPFWVLESRARSKGICVTTRVTGR